MANEYARIVDGVVVNVEVADSVWLEGNISDNEIFVEITNNDYPVIGLGWDKSSGFEQPKAVPLPSGFDRNADPSLTV